MSDTRELLAAYVESGSEDAFRELVRRYLDLVYSAALRLVDGDAHRAEDVAQTVFADLARAARTLAPGVMLGGWLHRHTCFIASHVMRGERRRQARERQAVEMNALQTGTEANLQRIAPILDEAVNQLSDDDRAAIMLRFFEQRDFHAVGEALGSSEDAARMRVNRALEKLQSLLKRHGVTATVAVLATLLSANAVHAAPAGLAATISAVASVKTSAALAATKTIAMTTMQKTLIVATLAFAIGSGIYEARRAADWESRALQLQRQRDPLADRLAQLEAARDAAARLAAALKDENEQLRRDLAEVPKLRGEVARLRSDVRELASPEAGATNDPTASAAQSWLGRVNRLKQRLEEMPGAKIPELQFLTENDWLNAARDNLNSDTDYRRAFSKLRGAVEGRFAARLEDALTAFMQANNQQNPTDLSQLQPYFESPVDDAVLQRWEIAPAKKVKNLGMGGDTIITQKGPVDEVFDLCYGVGPYGFGSTDFLSHDVEPAMDAVRQAYREAHNGQWPKDSSLLVPYATTPEQQAALQKILMRDSAGR